MWECVNKSLLATRYLSFWRCIEYLSKRNCNRQQLESPKTVDNGSTSLCGRHQRPKTPKGKQKRCSSGSGSPFQIIDRRRAQLHYYHHGFSFLSIHIPFVSQYPVCSIAVMTSNDRQHHHAINLFTILLSFYQSRTADESTNCNKETDNILNWNKRRIDSFKVLFLPDERTFIFLSFRGRVELSICHSSGAVKWLSMTIFISFQLNTPVNNNRLKGLVTVDSIFVAELVTTCSDDGFHPFRSSGGCFLFGKINTMKNWCQSNWFRSFNKEILIELLVWHSYVELIRKTRQTL